MMREDMARVICERPRVHGDGGKSIPPKGTKKRLQRNWRSEDCEDFKTFESNAPHRVYGWDAKEFGELLGPLKGFLRSRCGQRWDDVYSEVCENIDKGSVTQKHILTHLMSYVALDVEIIKGKIYYSKPQDYMRFYSRNEERMLCREITYVHPETGILMRNPQSEQPRYVRRRRDTTPVHLGTQDKNYCYCRDENGIWWACKLRDFAPTRQEKVEWREPMKGFYYRTVYDHKYDTFLGYTVDDNSDICERYYGDRHKYCWNKMQLNKRQIKQITKALEPAKKRA